jgi:hypothetical protein
MVGVGAANSFKQGFKQGHACRCTVPGGCGFDSDRKNMPGEPGNRAEPLIGK